MKIFSLKKRRDTKHILNDKIREAIGNTDGKTTLASTTLELIKIPEVKVNIKEEY